MKNNNISEKLLIEEVTQTAQKLKLALKGLYIGSFIKTIRKQLGMSQSALAKRAKIPQATVSRIETGPRDVTMSTLTKILAALSCDLIVAPLLSDSIDTIRRKQARKTAEKHVRYLKGTMSLEEQQPDKRFIEELLKQESEKLLLGPCSRLWEE